MTVKFILIAVIIAASAGLGRALAQNAKEELLRTKCLYTALGTVKTAYKSKGRTLSEALEEGARAGMDALSAIAREIAARPNADIYEMAARMLASERAICKPILREAAVLIERMGSAGIAEDISEAYAVFSRETEKRIEELEEASRRRSRVIRTLCLLGGMIAAVVIA